MSRSAARATSRTASRSSLFEGLEPAPPDAIFGLLDSYRRDPRPQKINLSAGVYTGADGTTPVLAAVKAAEARLVDSEPTKSYLPIPGLPEYRRRVPRLVLGTDHPALGEHRVTCAQAPGGTGALRVFGDLLARLRPEARIWLSDPTWANHAQVFGAVGLEMATYPYYDPATHGLAFGAMLEALEGVAAGDVVLFHAVCHNPTGVDPSLEQWRQIAEILRRRGALPLVDFAYQGFAEGIEEDAAAVRLLARELPEVVVASSYSKTFGLYRERVGALIVVTGSPAATEAAASHVAKVIRPNYSNPPAHGGQVVAEILGDPELRDRWLGELAGMRERIATMRRRLSEGLDGRGVQLSPEGNGFLAEQRGMFSFTGLTAEQVARLREEHAIYLVGSGRINVAGLNEGNLDRLCAAIAAVSG